MTDFHLLISGPDLEPVGRVELDCEDAAEAMQIAASVASPYGHELLDGARFLGRFDPAWGEYLDTADA